MASITELVIKARDPSHDPYRPAGVPDSFARPHVANAEKLSAPPVGNLAPVAGLRPQQQFANPTPAPAAPPAPPMSSPPRQHPWVPDDYQPPRPTFPSSQVPVPQSVIDGASRLWDNVEGFVERIGQSRPATPSTAPAPSNRPGTPGLDLRSIGRDATRQINDLLGGARRAVDDFLGGPSRVDAQGNEVRNQSSSAAPLAPGYSNRGESARVPIPQTPVSPQVLDEIISRMRVAPPSVHTPPAPATPAPAPARPSINRQPTQPTQPEEPISLQGYDTGIPGGDQDEGWVRTSSGWQQPR